LRADGGDRDLSASKVLHDYLARQHGCDLIIGVQRLMCQRRVARMLIVAQTCAVAGIFGGASAIEVTSELIDL